MSSTTPTADPSQAQGAQIPLDAFTIPEFPPSARNLKALTLTSAIPVASYAEALVKPFVVPTSLPFGIESLTLELFSLGYPAGFLTALANRLPNVKSLVVYSQLLPGTMKEQQADAVEFFRRLPNLRALHLLDVFAQPGFFSKVAEWVKWNTSEVPGEARRGLMFLEVNYTCRREEGGGVLGQIAGEELTSLVGPGLISLSFNIAIAEEEEGAIEAFETGTAEGLVKVLLGEETYPRGLRALNVTLYKCTVGQLTRILEKHKNVMVVNATVEFKAETLQGSKTELLSRLQQCTTLEQVEIVVATAETSMEKRTEEDFQLVIPTHGELETLSSKCSKMSSFKANLLRDPRLGAIEWERKAGVWEEKAMSRT